MDATTIAIRAVKAQALREAAAATKTHYVIDQQNKRHPREVPVFNGPARLALLNMADELERSDAGHA